MATDLEPLRTATELPSVVAAQPPVDRLRSPSWSHRFLLSGAAAAGVQALVPDGVARSLVAVLIYVAVTVAVVTGTRVHRPAHPGPWLLLALAMALFTLDFAGWTLETTGRAVAAAERIQDVGRLLATLALAAAIGLFLRTHRTEQSRGAAIDSLLIFAGAALMVWQWFVLVRGAAGGDLLARIGVPLVLAGLAITMLVAASRMGVSLISSEAMLLLLGGAVMALGAQAALTLTDTGSGPARWTDATWLVAGVFAAAAALHPSMAQRLTRPHRERQAASRLLVVGTVLLANPAIVWLHLFQQESDRRAVLLVAGAVAVLTLFGVGVAGRLIADVARMRAAVAESEDRFRSLVQHASDVIVVVDPGGVVTFASPSAEQVLGRSSTDLIDTKLVDIVAPGDFAAFAAFLDHAPMPRAQPQTTEVRLVHGSGELRHAEVVVIDLQHEPGVQGTLVTIRDVTERAQFEAELKHLASHDSLTGLANRALFSDRVSHALARIARHGQLVGVVFVDLDDFKTVNDSLGHLAGDELLMTVANRLRSSLRTADTAARLGGDEFAILLEDIESAEDAIPIVERISWALQQPVIIDGRPVQLGATMGVAIGRAASSTEELLRNADTAMFNAKVAGKGGFEIFHPEMHRAAVSRFDLKADLQQALETGQFELHYQPICSLADGAVQGVEALLRWHHPVRGLVLPADFIGLMEETGQIVDIGRWALREAFAQARRWQDRHGPLWMSVNLSVRQFRQADLVVDIRAALDQSGLAPSDVVIEITESVFIGDTDAAVLQLDRLKQLGVRLAIDDFGTGYSALSYLQRFRADIVKVDKSFVEALGGQRNDHTLARGIVGLARELGIITVGEGVERADQVVDLRAIDCELAQGFHLGEPQSAANLDLAMGRRIAAAEAPPAR